MSTDTAAPVLDTDAVVARGGHSRLLVTRQDPETRSYSRLGLLTLSEGHYEFRYSADEVDSRGFRRLLGFPDTTSAYRSERLFPLFSERVLDATRPEAPRMLEALALTMDASPMEFLARSGGRRGGDTIELLPIPDLGATELALTFLVHGVRYQQGAAAVIPHLRPGDHLHLEPDLSYTAHPHALLVTSQGQPLGWVPDPLLEIAHAAIEHQEHQVTVVRANTDEFGPHLRLLVVLTGGLPSTYCAPWDTASASDSPA